MVSVMRIAQGLKERRRHLRLPFDCPVRWSTGGVDRTGWTQDISDGGVGFTARALCVPEPGDCVRVSLDLDDQREWLVDTAATVVRCEPLGDGLYSVGVALSEQLPD